VHSLCFNFLIFENRFLSVYINNDVIRSLLPVPFSIPNSLAKIPSLRRTNTFQCMYNFDYPIQGVYVCTI